jgi:hypothetical protein
MEFLCRESTLAHELDTTEACATGIDSLYDRKADGLSIKRGTSGKPVVSIGKSCRHALTYNRSAFMDLRNLLNACNINAGSLNSRVGQLHGEVHFNDAELYQVWHLGSDSLSEQLAALLNKSYALKIHNRA